MLNNGKLNKNKKNICTNPKCTIQNSQAKYVARPHLHST